MMLRRLTYSKEFCKTLPCYILNRNVSFKPLTLDQLKIYKTRKREAKSEEAKSLYSEPISLISQHLIKNTNPAPLLNSNTEHLFSNKAELLEELKLIDNLENTRINSLKHEKKTISESDASVAFLESGVDTTVPISGFACSGCGAFLHCQDIQRPGFLPSAELTEVVDDRALLGQTVCRRCQQLTKHERTLKTTLHSLADYSNVMEKIREEPMATVVMVVDMLDLPGSIIPNLHDMVQAIRYIVVGNKVDLIPRDKGNWKKRWSDCLKSYCVESGIPEELISQVVLVSGTTGFGIDDLVNRMLSRELNTREAVFLVGCTNVGKSTIFNRLLQSDFCKAVARDHIHRATTSIWPGTTLGLLKFPIVSLTGPKRELRRRKLLEISETEKMKSKGKVPTNELPTYYQKLTDKVVISLESEIRVPKTVQSLRAIPTYTFDDNTGSVISSDYNEEHVKSDYILPAGAPFEERLYSLSHWCYDTPGFVNSDQIINYLTVKELSLLCKTGKMRLPRTLILQSGLSLLVGGLGQIDITKAEHPVYLTVHSCLPLHIMPTEDAAGYIKEFAGYLKVPNVTSEAEDRQGISPLPIFQSKEFWVEGGGNLKSVADIVLSTSGWASIACEGKVSFQASTPGGLGCALRVPSLLPFAVEKKGFRVQLTREFALRKGAPNTAKNSQKE